MRHFWRNRISFSTTKLVNAHKWDFVLHKRISMHCKIYSGLLNFSEFMVVSHRNMVSIYDMSRSEKDE